MRSRAAAIIGWRETPHRAAQIRPGGSLDLDPPNQSTKPPRFALAPRADIGNFSGNAAMPFALNSPPTPGSHTPCAPQHP
jgi:hypothetical protein